MDGVVRRYLDILYRYVLETEPPRRKPIFRPGIASEEGEALNGEDTVNGTNEQDPEHPSKKPKREKKVTSPNLLAIQAHLFHLLRPLLSKHTHIRDRLARARPGDMATYENILSMIEEVTRHGLLDYEHDPEKYEDDEMATTENGVGEGDGESSAKAVRECKRPWWVCQAYVRPLPKEALEKGSLLVSKRKKREEGEAAGGRRDGGNEGDGEAMRKIREGESPREKRDKEDGVPAAEMLKEGMVCG